MLYALKKQSPNGLNFSIGTLLFTEEKLHWITRIPQIQLGVWSAPFRLLKRNGQHSTMFYRAECGEPGVYEIQCWNNAKKIWSCLGKFAGSNQSEYAEHEDRHQDFFLKLWLVKWACVYAVCHFHPYYCTTKILIACRPLSHSTKASFLKLSQNGMDLITKTANRIAKTSVHLNPPSWPPAFL